MHLLEVVNPLVPSASDVSIVSAIWSGVGLVFYLWYLWSLARLFPLLGLKRGWGWIPVWNDWQLLQRGGLQGWLVLLALVPGLGGLVVLVLRIVAMFRINIEFGKGGGMTVLGAFIAPLWAMLLAKHISDGRYGAAAAWAPVREGAPAAGEASGLQGLPAANVPQAAAGYGAAQVGQGFAVPGFGAPGFGGAGLEQPQYAGAQVQAQAQAQVQAQMQAQAQVQAQGYAVDPQDPAVPDAHGYAHQGNPAGYPEVPSQVAYGAPGQQLGVAGAGQAFASPVAPQMPPQRSAFAPPVEGETSITQPTADYVSQTMPPFTPPNNWGFSAATEGEYARLAAEGHAPQEPAPLGASVQQQPFSWPAPQRTEAAPTGEFEALTTGAMPAVSDAQLIQGYQLPPTVAPSAATGSETVPPQAPLEAAMAELGLDELGQAEDIVPEQATADPAQQSPAGALQQAPDTFTTVSSVAPVPTAAAALTETPFASVAGSRVAAVPLTQTVPLAYVPLAPVAPITPVAPSGPVAVVTPVPALTPVAPLPVESEDDDATIVVRRATRWGLEMPDGEVLELIGCDVVVGRRPEPAGSYEVLQISDPTRTLSKSHMRLRRTGEVWTIEDLHSTNGVSLVDETGTNVPLEAGHERAATAQMLIGTLEVQLVRIV